MYQHGRDGLSQIRTASVVDRRRQLGQQFGPTARSTRGQGRRIFAAATLLLQPACLSLAPCPSRSVPKNSYSGRTSKLRSCGSWRAKPTGIGHRSIANSSAMQTAVAAGGKPDPVAAWGRAGIFRGIVLAVRAAHGFLRLPNGQRQRAEGEKALNSDIP